MGGSSDLEVGLEREIYRALTPLSHIAVCGTSLLRIGNAVDISVTAETGNLSAT